LEILTVRLKPSGKAPHPNPLPARGERENYSAATAATSTSKSSRTSRSMMSSVLGG
jgi:hypothetical protein